MKIAVADLLPNPHRDLSHYPVNDDKIAALMTSIKATEFWDNLVARRSPEQHGKFELAYGIHRLEALKKLKVEEIDIPVRNLSDSVLLQMMVHENQVEWAANVLVEQESVRAVVKAYGEGKIELARPRGNGPTRYAPGFSTSGGPEIGENKPYTAESVERFLGGEKAGWGTSKIEAILHTLGSIENELVEPEDLEGLTTWQAEQVSRQATRAEREVRKVTQDPVKAREVGKAISKRLSTGMRSVSGRKPGKGSISKGANQAVTLHSAKHKTDQLLSNYYRNNKPKKLPTAAKFVPDLAQKFADMLNDDKSRTQVEAIIRVRDELHTHDVKMLAGALRGLAKRATYLANKLLPLEG